MLYLSKEKLVVSLQRLTLYLSLLENSPVCRKQDAKKLYKYAQDFLADLIADQLTLEDATEQYQDLVLRVNAVSTHATYPKIQTRSITNLLRSDIIAFENCLHLYMLAGQLKVSDESKFFETATALWMSANEESAQALIQTFHRVVEQTNTKLPKELQYPLPQLAEYALSAKSENSSLTQADRA